MSTIKIHNLSFDATMDREAMDAIAGAWGWGSIKRLAKKGYKYAKKGVKWYGNCFRWAYQAWKHQIC